MTKRSIKFENNFLEFKNYLDSNGVFPSQSSKMYSWYRNTVRRYYTGGLEEDRVHIIKSVIPFFFGNNISKKDFAYRYFKLVNDGVSSISGDSDIRHLANNSREYSLLAKCNYIYVSDLVEGYLKGDEDALSLISGCKLDEYNLVSAVYKIPEKGTLKLLAGIEGSSLNRGYYNNILSRNEGFLTKVSKDLWGTVYNILSDTEIRVIRSLVLDGKSIVSIANDENYSRERIHQIISQVYRKLVQESRRFSHYSLYNGVWYCADDFTKVLAEEKVMKLGDLAKKPFEEVYRVSKGLVNDLHDKGVFSVKDVYVLNSNDFISLGLRKVKVEDALILKGCIDKDIMNMEDV